MSESIASMRVLTFNLWGIFNSKMKTERMMHFASKIEHYDVILLQEQFDSKDFELIKKQLSPEVRERYYFSRFQTGFYGSGCAVISKYPILSAFSFVYPLQGFPEMLLHGDFFANKGVARVVVNVPLSSSNNDDAEVQHQPVIFYITHLVATYQKVRELPSDIDERYLPFRISQAISLANYIINTSSPRNYLVIGGDFNATQDSLEVRMMLILLRNKGYRMQSVLPSPATPEGKGSKVPSPELIDSFYTYSYQNAFNSSSTSYFKLLNQEADIPSQIDHIFYSSNTFRMASFEDCPDAAEGFPFYRDVKGEKVPNGVVVFLKNEVRKKSKGSLLRKWACAFFNPFRGASAVICSRQESALNGASKVNLKKDHQADLYPISDHYGVGTRLNLLARCDGYDSRFGSGVMSPTLRVASFTQEDLEVVEEVLNVLQRHILKLRHQTKVFRIISAVSVLVLIINAYSLMRVTSTQENRTAELLRRLYNMKSGDSCTGEGGASLQSTWNQEIKNFLNESIRSAFFFIPGYFASWTSKILQTFEISGVFGFVDDKVSPYAIHAHGGCLNIESDPDFDFVAKNLANRSFWTNAMFSSAIHVMASLFGFSAFLIGNIQRLGNTKVLEDEVNMILPLLSRFGNEFRDDVKN